MATSLSIFVSRLATEPLLTRPCHAVARVHAKTQNHTHRAEASGTAPQTSSPGRQTGSQTRSDGDQGTVPAALLVAVRTVRQNCKCHPRHKRTNECIHAQGMNERDNIYPSLARNATTSAEQVARPRDLPS